MTKAYVFYDDERSIPYKDERVVLPQRLSQYNCYYLAIFMPNQPNTKDFEESTKYALKKTRYLSMAARHMHHVMIFVTMLDSITLI